MGDKVLSLVPNLAVCPDQPSIATALRRFADLIEADTFPGSERVICILQCDAGVIRRTYGRSTNFAEVIGLLHFAIDGVMRPLPDEE